MVSYIKAALSFPIVQSANSSYATLRGFFRYIFACGFLELFFLLPATQSSFEAAYHYSLRKASLDRAPYAAWNATARFLHLSDLATIPLLKIKALAFGCAHSGRISCEQPIPREGGLFASGNSGSATRKHLKSGKFSWGQPCLFCCRHVRQAGGEVISALSSLVDVAVGFLHSGRVPTFDDLANRATPDVCPTPECPRKNVGDAVGRECRLLA